jgi:hypothetical protein
LTDLSAWPDHEYKCRLCLKPPRFEFRQLCQSAGVEGIVEEPVAERYKKTGLFLKPRFLDESEF